MKIFFVLAAAALKALADSAQALGAKKDSIQFKFAGPNKPVIATMPLDNNVMFEAVIMPMIKSRINVNVFLS